MKYSVKYKKVFNSDKQIVDIDSVNEDNRLPEYYSIGTSTPMIAVLGSNQHHFRSKRGYKLNPETELHEYAKIVLKHRFDTESHFYIKYHRKEYCPFENQCIFCDNRERGCEILNDRLCEYDLKEFYDTATVEGGYDGFVADVLLTSSSHKRRPVFLEIAVTHPCSEEKIASGNKIVELFIKQENDAYKELKQTDSHYYDQDEPIIRFYHFEDKIRLLECPHFANKKKYAQQQYIIGEKPIKTFFCCVPINPIGNPLQAYFDNVQIGMHFAHNIYASPFVFDKAFSKDRSHFVILGKDLKGAMKKWVVYDVTWKGNKYEHRVDSHFDYQGALQSFILHQGKEWLGGDTLSDECM